MLPMVDDQLFALMKAKGITVYRLRKDRVIGAATIEKMQQRRGHIDTRSLERLCDYLGVQPGDLMEYIPNGTAKE